jgi:hypothetical protein
MNCERTAFQRVSRPNLYSIDCKHNAERRQRENNYNIDWKALTAQKKVLSSLESATNNLGKIINTFQKQYFY